jgi:hypothetical protein
MYMKYCIYLSMKGLMMMEFERDASFTIILLNTFHI